MNVWTVRRNKNGSCREVAVVESLKQEWTYGLSAETKMAVVVRLEQEWTYGLSAETKIGVVER